MLHILQRYQVQHTASKPSFQSADQSCLWHAQPKWIIRMPQFLCENLITQGNCSLSIVGIQYLHKWSGLRRLKGFRNKNHNNMLLMMGVFASGNRINSQLHIQILACLHYVRRVGCRSLKQSFFFLLGLIWNCNPMIRLSVATQSFQICPPNSKLQY